jgi:Flp pilus assembly protein TadG
MRLRLDGRRRATHRIGLRGQAIVEMALVAPILIVMLLGGAQVAEIAYGEVSVDTAAREGARAGALAPNSALASAGATWYSAATPSHQCTAGDFTAGSTGNPICVAVLDTRGLLDSNVFTSNPCGSPSQACVTITVLAPNALSKLNVGPPMARLVRSSCNNSQATVTGTVSSLPSGSTATITASTGETQPTDQTGAFTICVKANGATTTQTLTAQSGSTSCGGYSGSYGPFSVAGGVSYPETITVTAEAACSAPPPVTNPPPTDPPPPPGPPPVVPPGPSVNCAAQTVPDSYFIQVKLSYPISVFVPIVGTVFESQPGLRQINALVTYAIDPCTMTGSA